MQLIANSSLIVLGLSLLLSAAPARADHISSYQAQHLLQWDQRRDFFDGWLDAKLRNKNQLFRGLLEGHSEQLGSYRISKRVPASYLTLDQLNQRWLKLAIAAYQRRDWVDANHSLSQLEQPVSPLLMGSAKLLQQATSIQLQQLSAAASAAVQEPVLTDDQLRSNPELTGLQQYNYALTLINKQQYIEALPLLEQLRRVAPKKSKFNNRSQLLSSFALANAGNIEQAQTALQALTLSADTAELEQPIKAQLQLASGDKEAAIRTLLTLNQQTPQQQVDAANVALLTQLQHLNARTQAALLASQLMLPLQQRYVQLSSQVQQIASPAFIEQLAKRHSGEPPTTMTELFSKETRLLLVELERINSLLIQVRAQQPLIKQQITLFNRGYDHIKSQMIKHHDLVASGSILPLEITSGDPKIGELESRLSMLVGQPEPWQHRYTLLDGLAVWLTDNPFKHPWWQVETIQQESGSGTITRVNYLTADQIDLEAATQELAKFQAEQISKTALLEEIRIEEELPRLPILAKRLKAMESQLTRQKQLLLSALTETLQFEPARMVAELEQSLLWLSIQTVPHAPQFDHPEQQRWFYPHPNQTDSTATSSPPQTSSPLADNPLPPYDFALSALQALADNALNSNIRHQAIHHLADLKLLLSERIINGDPIPPRADISPASAIALYEQLLTHNNPAIDRQQVLYQLAKAYEFEGLPEPMLTTLIKLVESQPPQPLLAEAQFRVAELQFNLKQFDLAEQSYRSVLSTDAAAEYHSQARYKLAWSAFKQGEYPSALQEFFALIEPAAPATQSQPQAVAPQQALQDDTLRVIALTFAYMEGSKSLQQYFDQTGPQPYEAQVYRNLAAYFDYKHRYNDAATAYDAMVLRFPNDPKAALYQSRVIAAYTAGGFPSKAWPAREQLIERFGIDSAAWQQADEARRELIRPYLSVYLIELAQRDHALAQQTRSKALYQPVSSDTDDKQVANVHYQKALGWYDQFISALPQSPRLPEMLFLKAEALSETNQLPEAADTYKQVAYQYPNYERSDEAGYAALLAYQSLYKQAPANSPKSDRWLQKGIEESLLFSDTYPNSKYTARIRTKVAEDLLIQDQYQQAIDMATTLQQIPDLDIPYQIRLWRVVGHAQFDTQQFSDAERSYQQLLGFEIDKKEQDQIHRRIAEAIYKQGEQAQQAGDQLAALNHFQRLGKLAPDAHVLPQAEFDAATLLLSLKRWPEAVVALEQFRNKRAGNKLQATIDEKLVVAYEQTNNWSKAAAALQRIFEREGKSELGRDALWRSAALEEKAHQPKQAVNGYQRFLEAFPTPHEPAMEARLKLYQLAQQLDNSQAQQRWLQAIVAVENNAGTASTDRTLTIASDASLTLGKQAMSTFLLQQLTLPLDKSLPRKQQAMESSIRHLTQVTNFGLSKQGTEATALIGQLYSEFAQALMSSQRPNKLNELELEQYEILLEEQALPFEDKAITLHEINLGQIGQGIYTPAIGISINELRQMMPARYNKPERVPEYSDAID